MSGMFRSFAVYNYRVWFFGALVSNIGIWMQSIAQNWVVLTELTANDSAAMGVSMTLQLAPPLLLVAITGWAADRFDRRVILLCAQSCLIVLSVTVGVLLINDRLSLIGMYAFSLIFGLILAFESPARQAFVSDMVTREFASNAVALNAASFNAARMIGPAAAGLAIVAFGSGWVFLLNAVAFLGLIVALISMHVRELVPRVLLAGRSRLSEGFRYVAQRPDVAVVLSMVFLLGGFGMTFPIYGSTMALEFDRQADGFGILSSILAVGSLCGALLAARRERARVGVVVAAAGLFALAMAVSAVMPSFWTYAAALTIVGFAVVTAMTTGNGYVQTTADPAVRGRVLALYIAVFMGGAPTFAPLLGWIAREFGPRAAIGTGALGGLVGFAIGLTWFLLSRRGR